jgi:hypothetical protein
MSILNVNQIQPVGSGQTITISATNIDTGSATVTAGTFSGGVTVTSGNLTGITSVSTSNLTVNGNAYPSSGPLSNRNLIINGAMQVAQRGTSDTGFSSSSYAADRFRINVSNMGTWNGSNSSTAPDGFTNSCKFVCATADASPASADFINFKQIFEGQDLQHLKYGTSSSESLTLSFWVRSNKTGTYTVELDRESTDFNSISYTISSADTWEYKTVTFSGLTGSSIPNDNTEGLKINWWLAGGSNYSSGTQINNTWHTTTANRLASGQVNLADAVSNEWYITGVQLEVGTVATPFEHRSYGDELARCQRYYYRAVLSASDIWGSGYNQNTTVTRNIIHFPVTMRTQPTAVETTGTSGDYRVLHGTTVTACSAVPTFNSATTHNGEVQATVSSGLTAGQGNMLETNTNNAYLAWSAEL